MTVLRAGKVLLCMLVITPLMAQQDIDVERGFRPGQSFESATGIDSTNLFNGTTNLRIGLGSWSVGGSLSYSLTAHGATNTWSTGHHEIDRYPLEPLSYDYTYPWEHQNSGHGWIVTLGKLHLIDGTDEVWYIDPDGTQHRFYYTLHGSNPAEQPQHNGSIYWIRYTRDGSYLRLKIHTNKYELGFPNGHLHTFDTGGRLTKMEDTFGNNVSIGYGSQQSGDPFPGSAVWTISDSVGRTQKVYFRPGPSYVEDVFGESVPHELIHRVDVAAFGGATAQYLFAYENEASGFSQISRRCGRRNDPEMQVVNAPLLTSITLNGYLQYTMEYAKGDQANCSNTRSESAPFPGASGNFTKVTLPTGASLNWTYQRFVFPGNGAGVNAGVATRTATNPDGTVLASTTYVPETVPTSSIYTDVVRTVIESDAPFKTRHYFSTCRVTNPLPDSCATGGLYGFPVTTSQSSDGAYLSNEVLEKNASNTFVVVRKTYRKYEGDYNLTNVGQGEFNQRPSFEKTAYEDGSSTSSSSTDFDGLGHYRSMTNTGSWGLHNTRTSFTNFNPNAGSYAVDENHNLITTFTLPAIGSTWLLTSFDKTRATESRDGSPAETTESAACFDSLGFLTSRRVYKNAGAGPTATINDLLARFTRDSSGNLTTEQYVGGDTGVLAPVPFTCGSTLASETYRIDHRYSNGVRARSYYADSSGPLSFFLMDREIDQNTGLVTLARQASTPALNGNSNGGGIVTNYQFDLLGRLTDALPQGAGRRAKSKFTYTMNAPSVTIQEIDGTTTLRTATTNFDRLGRVKSETRTMPNGSASRTMEYDTLGRKTADWNWGATEPTRMTYDTFGRPTAITAPDGTSTTLSYTGASKVERTTSVRTGSLGGAGDYTPTTTTQELDPLTRLWRATEPPPTVAGTRPMTEYTYDGGGRLAKVCANKVGESCGQTRELVYDARGFLTRETHPESGTSGNGDTSFAGYDARGHATRRYNGSAASPSFDLRFTFDRAERLTRMYRSDERTLKRFTFAGANAASDWRNGRLAQAVRYNWLDSAGIVVKVIEDYGYEQPDGLLSARTTSEVLCAINPGPCEDVATGTESRNFEQTFGYDKLGAPATLGYPDCTLEPCATSTSARTVTNSYTGGWLTGVTWNGASAASAMSYWPTGAVHQVTHGNTVVDTQTIDLAGRALQLTTTNAVDHAGCVAPTFSVQPQPQTITSGETATLTASASGETGHAITYQWYRGLPADTSAPEGSPSTSGTRPVTPTATTTYWVRATNDCPAGTANSVAATVNVCASPSITGSPTSQTVTRGQSITLTVTASGSSPKTYQWFTVVGGVPTPINGATASTLSVSPTATTTYRASVTNDCGVANSSSATVTVVDPPTAPLNVVAAKEGTASIRVTWSASSSAVGIASYRVERLPDGIVLSPVYATSILDSTSLVAGSAYTYRVYATDSNGVPSAPSTSDLATLMSFQDDPIVVGETVLKGIHVGQMRQAIDSVRVSANLAQAWTSYGAATGDVLASDFITMRDKLNEARSQLQLPAIEFSVPVGVEVLIRASHMMELRGGVQ